MNKFFTNCVALVMLAFILCGCGKTYSVEEIESIKQQAYNEGFNAGYDRGAHDQYEIVCEEFLIDGLSIRDVSDEVVDEFGMTPADAFNVYDNYTYDWTHGGYTWEEYQLALEAMYYTCCIFPFDY